MRWIKHPTTTEAPLSVLIDKHGLEIYGFYWLLVETVAASFDLKSGSPALALTEKTWARTLRVSTRVFRKFCQSLAEVSLVLCQNSGETFQIVVPNILKYRDEYSKKSGHSPDTRTDTDREREKEKNSPPTPSLGQDPEPIPIREAVPMLAERFPRTLNHDPDFDTLIAVFLDLGLSFSEQQRSKAATEWVNLDDVERVRAIEHLASVYNEWRGRATKYIPSPWNFLREKPWNAVRIAPERKRGLTPAELAVERAGARFMARREA